MRSRAPLAGALLLLLAGAARPSQAFTLHYDVRFGPLRLLSMRTTVDLAADSYRTTTVVRTEGLIGVLFPWTSESVTEGLRDPLRPRRHASDGRFRGQRRVVEIAYGDDGAVQARIEPPSEQDWRDAVPPDAQRFTVDPLTASLATIEQGCQGRVPVFDGRRRYDLRLEDGGIAELGASPHGVYAGPTRRCRAVIEPFGGFWRSDGRESETPAALEFWIASPRPELVPMPVYLELSGARGTLRIHLSRIDMPGGAPG